MPKEQNESSKRAQAQAQIKYEAKYNGAAWHAISADAQCENVESADERALLNSLNSGAKLIAGAQPYWIDSVGQYLCDEIRLQVGSQIVDTVYNYYLKMWDELSDKPGRVMSKGYGEMTMKGSAEDRKKWSRTARSVFVPIPMFFTRTSGNALPLIALSFHGVKISLKTADFSQCIVNYKTDEPKAPDTAAGKHMTVVRDGQGATIKRQK